jgi:ATP-dependent protease ClpP protease subunit
MGFYTEYLDRRMNMEQLTAERKNQLARISQLHGDRDILVVAADLNKVEAPITINYSDLLAVNDQLSVLKGEAIDLILETPGGSGEVAEDIVRLLHQKYQEVAVIIPGYAKSAGTIIAMAGDEILMGPESALGPIDAQLMWQGKTFSADALLKGIEKIKEEIQRTGVLNKAYIPILQGISPGELQRAENELEFAKALVTDWLARYKFKNWSHHSTTGQPVTEDEKKARAAEIAAQLCDHSKWLTHGRSIKLDDFSAMRLLITDYSEAAELCEAIRRYYTLLQMTFASNIYKVFERASSQIYRFLINQQVSVPTPVQKDPAQADVAHVNVKCGKCNAESRVQDADFGANRPLNPEESGHPFRSKPATESGGKPATF